MLEKRYIDLETKPDMRQCLDRVYAWWEGELLDRPPVRFSRHNAEFDVIDSSGKKWKSLKDRWFDAEYQVEKCLKQIEEKKFVGETFPMFWPNLGPNMFAACYGCPCEYAEVTAWAEPILKDLPGADHLPQFDWQNEYIKKLDEMTDLALAQSKGRFLVGYSDIICGLDCCAALRGTEDLLLDLIDQPEKVGALNDSTVDDFLKLYDHFDKKLKDAGQISITWMNIPSYGKMYIPDCDFSFMISTEKFAGFAVSGLEKICLHMDHNIFHMDGKGVAKHLDEILKLPKINAIQWVQGLGEDQPIMQWVPLIKKIQAAGKGVVVDLMLNELDAFMLSVSPKGIYLCIETNDLTEEQEVLKKLEKWVRRKKWLVDPARMY